MSAIRFGSTTLLLLLAALPAFAQLRIKSYSLPMPSQPSVLDSVNAKQRDAVASVMKAPTLSTRTTEDSFKAHTAVYSWMVDNPDRVSLAWQRLDVPCVDITCPAQRTFAWKDEHGSKLTWEPVAKLNDGLRAVVHEVVRLTPNIVEVTLELRLKP